jgi:hypothetical protein
VSKTPPKSLPPIDLGAPGWLAAFLPLYLDAHAPVSSERSVMQALAEHAEEPHDVVALRIADRRLDGMHLRQGPPPLSPALSERLLERGIAAGDVPVLALLATQLDILMDVALLHGNRSGRHERAVEMLTILALAFKDVPLARGLHDEHLATLKAADSPLETLAAPVEALLGPRIRMHKGARATGALGSGLAYLEARVLASIGSLYFERSSVEEEGVARLLDLSVKDKVGLIELLVALAWADGKLVPEERRMIERQVQLAELPRATKERLLGLLDHPPDADELVLEPLEPSARRFVLEQAILLSLVDDELDPREQWLLRSLSERLGASEHELEQAMVEVTAFYEKNRDAIRDFGPVSGAFGRLRAMVLDRAQQAVVTNARRIMQEVRETGELARLLGAASVRPLSHDESARVKAQLLDVCKTIPALAIFVLPGGGLLLPILLKVLPFNLLPTAFTDEPPAASPGPGSPA